jgi:hypothetical protein
MSSQYSELMLVEKVESRKCLTQVFMLNSDIVTPRESLDNERLVKTCPRKLTNTVTKLNSIVFAKSANNVDAVAGVICPFEMILRPYRGCQNPNINHRPEKSVEYIERSRIDIESQLFRDE